MSPSTGTHDYQPARQFTTELDGNIDDLDFGGASIIRVSNLNVANLRGLKRGYAGQIVTVVSIGAERVNLIHNSAGSLAPNRLRNFITSGPTPLKAMSGVATFQYDASTELWRLIHHRQGGWLPVPYDANNFTADVGTWVVGVGDQEALDYLYIENTMFLSFRINTSTTTGTPNQLRITLPDGQTILVGSRNWAFISTVATGEANGLIGAIVGNTYIIIRLLGIATPFPNETNTVYVSGVIPLGIT